MTAIFETCCALHNQLLEYDGWEFDESLTDIPENIHDGAFLGHDEFMDNENPYRGIPHYVPHCPSDNDSDSDDGGFHSAQGSGSNEKYLRHCRRLDIKSMLINHFCILKEGNLIWPRHRRIPNT